MKRLAIVLCLALSLGVAPARSATLNLTDFGARCDGSANDTAALRNWLNTLAEGDRGELPAGTCLFDDSLAAEGAALALPPGASRVAIVGAGPYQSVLKYVGASTNVDLLRFGDHARGFANSHLANFRITSDTAMTGGAAIHVRLFLRSMVNNVVLDGQDGAGRLFNGFWCDGCDVIQWFGVDARVRGAALMVNGVAGNPGSDFFVSMGKISGSAVGVHVGGGFGGFQLENIDVIGNDVGMVIDRRLFDETNREVTFGATVAFDSSNREALRIDNAGNLYVHATGTWFASSKAGPLISISPASTRTVLQLDGVKLFNAFNGNHGIAVRNAGAIVYANSGLFRHITGTAIHATVPTTNVHVGESMRFLDAQARWNANVRFLDRRRPQAAWPEGYPTAVPALP